MTNRLLRSIATLFGLGVLLTLLIVGCQSLRHSSGPELASKPDGALRLATYNIHYILMNEKEGRWSVGHWERRKVPLDAAFKAIEAIVNSGTELQLYSVNNITSGTDAQGEVTVRLEKGGHIVNGQGADTDIVIASARAYVNALNKIIRPDDREHPQRGDV